MCPPSHLNFILLPPSLVYPAIANQQISASSLVDPALLDNLPHPPVVLPPIFVVKPAGLGVGRTGGVGIAQQTLDAGEDGGNVVDGTPLVLEDVQADLPVVVDVGVEHFGEEPDVRGLVGVVLGELQDQLERSALPRGVVGAEDDGLPHHNVVVHRCAGNSRGGIILESVGVVMEVGNKWVRRVSDDEYMVNKWPLWVGVNCD